VRQNGRSQGERVQAPDNNHAQFTCATRAFKLRVVAESRETFEAPLAALGQLLEERGLRYELYAVGGGALQLLGLITRPTRDIDIAGTVEGQLILPIRALPSPLVRAIEDTARVFRISPQWVNAGPRSLLDLGLPQGAIGRAHRRQWAGLVLNLAARRDQIFFKLYAAADQGPRSKHYEDLRRLRPTREELRAAAAWARTHDPSEGFETELRAAVRDLGVADDQR